MTLTVTLLNKLGRNKDKSIDKAKKSLTKETLLAQKRLTKFVVNQYLPNLDVSDGVIKNTNANIVKANNIGRLTSFVNNEINKSLEKRYLQSTKSNLPVDPDIEYFPPKEAKTQDAIWILWRCFNLSLAGDDNFF